MKKLFVVWGVVLLLFAAQAVSRAGPQQNVGDKAALIDQLASNPLDLGASEQQAEIIEIPVGMGFRYTLYMTDIDSPPVVLSVAQPAEASPKSTYMATYTKATRFNDTSKRQRAMEAVLKAAPTTGFRTFVRRI